MTTTNIADLPNAQSFGWADSAFSRSAAGLVNVPGMIVPLGSLTNTIWRPFGGAAGTGFYWINTTNLSLGINGAERFRFGSAGLFIALDGVAFGGSVGLPQGSIRGNGAGIIFASGSSGSAAAAIEQMNFTTPPAAPAAGRGRLYYDIDGGKLRLMCRFPTGAAQVVAIEP